MAQIISPAHGLQPFPSLSPVHATTPLPFPSPAIRVMHPPSPEVSEGSSTSTIRASTVAWPKRIRGQPAADDLALTSSPPRSDPTAAIAATAPVGKVAQHQPVLPGKPGTLRLNLDSIKRTLSESHIVPIETLVRKKSGQVVKSSLKPHARTQSDVGLAIKSAPTTPIERKVVHFDAKLEHIRLFLAEQKPLAVSRDGSPTLDTSDADEFPFPLTTEDTRQLPPHQRRAAGGAGQLCLKFVKMPSLPQPALDRDVYLEDLQLAADAQSLNGIVQVRNIAFAKWIAVRFTFDWWQTTSEVTARYLDSVRNGAFDRFTFTLRLGESQSRITDKVLFLAIRYSVDGREIWDNNGGENYQVHFEIKKAVVVVAPVKAAPTTTTTTLATNGNEAQVADFRRELEKVAADKQNNVRTWVGQQAASSASAVAAATSPVTSPKATRPSFLASHRYSSFPAPSAGSDPRRKVPDPSSLKQRYDFGASLRNAWSPPDFRPHRSTVSYPMGSAVPFPSTATHQQHHAVPFPSPTPTTTTTTERPFAARRAGALSPGRGSPRDADDLLPRFTLDPERDYRSPPPAPQLKPVSDDGLARPSRPRNHQRSYFDSWAAQHTPPAVKKTPSSGNVPTTAPSSAVVDGPPPALEESESSSDTETDTTTTEDEDRDMSTPRLGNVQPATPTKKEGEEDEAAFPRLARSPSSRALRHDDTAANPLSPSWSGAMSLSPLESSLASTPSATLASSPAQSPSSPPLESMPSYDDGSLMSVQGDRDSTHYNFFLNRFCFFTGVPGTPEGYYNSISQRRAQSASGVDFTRTPRNGKQQPPSSNDTSPEARSPNRAEMNHYGFPSNQTSALGIHSKSSPTAGDVSPPGGTTTPTATAADTVTPRPETPAGIAFSPISSVSVAG